jgi:hypothetical protein
MYGWDSDISFHLKTSTPSGFSTRKHSANPVRRSSRQSGPSFPYFADSQLLGPARNRCGGELLSQEVAPKVAFTRIRSLLAVFLPVEECAISEQVEV